MDIPERDSGILLTIGYDDIWYMMGLGCSQIGILYCCEALVGSWLRFLCGASFTTCSVLQPKEKCEKSKGKCNIRFHSWSLTRTSHQDKFTFVVCEVWFQRQGALMPCYHHFLSDSLTSKLRKIDVKGLAPLEQLDPRTIYALLCAAWLPAGDRPRIL